MPLRFPTQARPRATASVHPRLARPPPRPLKARLRASPHWTAPTSYRPFPFGAPGRCVAVRPTARRTRAQSGSTAELCARRAFPSSSSSLIVASIACKLGVRSPDAHRDPETSFSETGPLPHRGGYAARVSRRAKLPAISPIRRHLVAFSCNTPGSLASAFVTGRGSVPSHFCSKRNSPRPPLASPPPPSTAPPRRARTPDTPSAPAQSATSSARPPPEASAA